MNNNSDIQMLEFNDGNFTTAEMNELILKMIDDRINYQKLQFLKNWEQNHLTDQTAFAQKIEDLQQKKSDLNIILAQAKENQATVNIQDTLQFRLVG